VPLGTAATRALPLASAAPVDMEFSVRITKPSAAFEIGPSAGIVPSGGAAEVTVTFQPLALATEEARFEVRRLRVGPSGWH
jgi:hypothetical protein